MKKITILLHFTFIISSWALNAENAPVTMAGNVTNATPGTSEIDIPVTILGFSNIGQFSLTMKFDTTRVRFVSAVNNPDLPGMNVTYYPPSGNTQGKLTFIWTGGGNVSLADGSSLTTLTFSYVTSTGLLSWSYTYGSICQYSRYVDGTLTPLNDSPKYQFYKNGGIANRGAPVTTAPVVTMMAPGSFSLPVTVNGFTSIGALTLYLEYDPAIVTYQNTFTKNPAFGSSFLIGNIAGTGGKMLIIMQWYGNTVTLTNGAILCTLNFNYIAANGTSALTWFDNISSCEYADGSGTVLIDLPKSEYYHDGIVTPPLIANFIADKLTPTKTDTVLFTDQSTGGAASWSWGFDRHSVVFLNGTDQTSQNPQVKFTEGGLYSVTLVITNIYLSDSEEKPEYVRAGIPGSWTGNTSSDWYILSNWDNWIIPDSSTSVVIPPVAPNWPVFEGNLTLGMQCGNLTLSGATSQMTVTGDLTIP